MSYCVNCGVELDASAEKCALCSTPVLNPNAEAGIEPPPYPEKIVIPAGTRRKYIWFITSMVILIPNIVCGIINFLLPQTGTWAIFVIASSLLVWIIFILPFFWDEQYPYLMFSLDTIALALYVYIFYNVKKEEGWFFSLALPLTITLGALLLLLTWWLRRKKRDWPQVLIAVLICISVFSVEADLLFGLFYHNSLRMTYSLVVVSSCLALVAFFIYVTRSKRMRAWLSRKFFVK